MATRVLVICAICLIGRGTSTCPETKYLVSGTRPIPDEYLTASSVWNVENMIIDNHSPGRSRLDTKEIHENNSWLNGCWAARTNNAQQWRQARFLERSYITGIVTQGRNVERGYYQRVTSYQFHFSTDCMNFVTITQPNSDNEIFLGNTDQDSHVTNVLQSPVRALCVRIQPVTWVGHVSLRFDVLGCPCGNRYGSKCEHICPTNCASVNNNTWCDDQGVCVDGCFLDFFGRQCNNPCPSNCATGANSSRCDQQGVCVNGCKNDHFGSKCSNPCPTNCVQGANGSRCDQQGDCVNGCVNDHFGQQCSNLCPTNCAPVAGGSRCSDPGTCTMGCIAGYTGSKCESSIGMLEESGSGYKNGMIASLIVAVVAIVIIAVMIFLLQKKRQTSTDVNRSFNVRSGLAEAKQYSMDTCNAYCILGKQRTEAEPYASINFGHA